MLFLLDANILIYGANPASPFFAQCKGATRVIMQNGDTPCIVPQSLYEFWTVATRKPNPQSALSGLGMTPAQAYAEIVAQINLQPILGARGVTSEIVNGKRSIMKEQAKRLGAFFGVSPAVFI